jgi:hypothetical protein
MDNHPMDVVRLLASRTWESSILHWLGRLPRSGQPILSFMMRFRCVSRAYGQDYGTGTIPKPSVKCTRSGLPDGRPSKLRLSLRYTGPHDRRDVKGRCRVSMAPFPDAERDANAAVLCSLPPPFRAWLDMTQRGGPEDGWLSWTEPILANKSVGLPYYSSGTDHPRPLTLPRAIPPGGIPLKVGNSPPSRTALHMYEEFGVARWPYESTMITIFISSRYPRCMWDVPELADS